MLPVQHIALRRSAVLGHDEGYKHLAALRPSKAANHYAQKVWEDFLCFFVTLDRNESN